MSKHDRANYQHPEAFCLMTYQCERCSRIEKLWNSRDGVTPFCIECSSCDGQMTHINWKSDRYWPDYPIQPGERFFTDLTLDEVKVIARMRAEIGSIYAPAPESVAERERIIQSIIGGFRQGEPTIKVFRDNSRRSNDQKEQHHD